MLTFLEIFKTKVKFNYSTLRKIELKMINSLNELKTKLRKKEDHPPLFRGAVWKPVFLGLFPYKDSTDE